MATLSLSSAAFAADTETVVVTGSRIPTANFVTNSPLQTVTSAEISAVGTSTVETYLDSLPQFSPAATKTQNNPPYGGAATLDLRQLGSNRTLVLVDGRRVIPGFSNGTVDVSVLPPGLIDRVEVITGGASAVYGSDAVAGVVNFITKKDFEGVQTSIKYGQSDISDAQEYTVDALIGGNFAGGKGNAVLAFSYDHRAAVGEGARDISKRAEVCDTTGCYASGSATVPDGRISVNPGITQAAWDALWATPAYGSHPAGSIPLKDSNGSPNIGFNPDGSIFALAPVTNYKGPYTGYSANQYSYNYNPDNLLQLPFERYSFNGKANYSIAEKTELYANLLLTRYTSQTDAAPAPNSLKINARAVDTTTGETYLQEFSPDFYHLLINSGFTDATLPTALRVARRSNELGPRQTDFDTLAYQGTIGIRGEVEGTFGKKWNYEAFASYGIYKLDTYNTGFLSTSRVTAAAAGCPSSAPPGKSACVTVDPFGAGSITADQINYLADPYYDNSLLTQEDVEFNLAGDLFDLPAGPVGFSIGSEYRQETYKDIPDINLQTGDVGAANQAVSLQGGYAVTEGYGETKVPVLSGLPFVNYLGLEGGIRYSSYSSGAGTTWTYKWGGEYSPIEGIRFRGLVQRAVRAPSVGELYQQQAGDYPPVEGLAADPCSSGSAARTGADASKVLGLCQAQAPAVNFNNFTSTFNANTQLYGVQGGNPNLGPETAHTWTLGVQITPPSSWGEYLQNFNFSADYYHINVAKIIGATSAATSLSRCFDPSYNPSYSAGNAYCAAIHRDPASGGLTSVTEPDGWIAENSANLGAEQVRGIDFQANYGFGLGDLDAGLGDLGVISANFVGGWMLSEKIQSLPGDAFTEYTGEIGNGEPGATALPKWKHSLRLGWELDPVGVNLRWYHIGHVTDPNASGTDINHIAPFDYFYLDINYQVLSNVGLTLGVDNLFDKNPPRYTNAFQYNTDPSTYDVIGRYLYFRITLKN